MYLECLCSFVHSWNVQNYIFNFALWFEWKTKNKYSSYYFKSSFFVAITEGLFPIDSIFTIPLDCASVQKPSPSSDRHLLFLWPSIWMLNRKPQQGQSFYVFRFNDQWKATVKALQVLWVLGVTVTKPVSWMLKGRWECFVKADWRGKVESS